MWDFRGIAKVIVWSSGEKYTEGEMLRHFDFTISSSDPLTLDNIRLEVTDPRKSNDWKLEAMIRETGRTKLLGYIAKWYDYKIEGSWIPPGPGLYFITLYISIDQTFRDYWPSLFTVPDESTSPSPETGEMVLIPAGSFRMGDPFNEGDSGERPVHTVYVDAFYMDVYEVTNAQYCVFLNEQGNQTEGGYTWLDIGNSDCLITKSGGQFVPKNGYEDHPVIEVTWYGARLCGMGGQAASHRSRVGVCGQRRLEGQAVSLGRRHQP